jgi:hypothetical protein
LAKAATRLIVELDVQFLKQAVLDAMGVIYPQYWLQVDAKMTFPRHLEVLKGFYCTPRPSGQSKDAPMVHPILSTWELDVH